MCSLTVRNPPALAVGRFNKLQKSYIDGYNDFIKQAQIPEWLDALGGMPYEFGNVVKNYLHFKNPLSKTTENEKQPLSKKVIPAGGIGRRRDVGREIDDFMNAPSPKKPKK